MGVVLLSSLQLHARLRCSSRPYLTRRPVSPQDKTSPSEWKDPQDILSSPQVVSIYPPPFLPGLHRVCYEEHEQPHIFPIHPQPVAPEACAPCRKKCGLHEQ